MLCWVPLKELTSVCVHNPVIKISSSKGTQQSRYCPPLTCGRKYPLSETLCNLVFRIPDDGQSPCVIHHRQNPLESIYFVFLWKSRRNHGAAWPIYAGGTAVMQICCTLFCGKCVIVEEGELLQ
jgi:hypothetical protein